MTECDTTMLLFAYIINTHLCVSFVNLKNWLFMLNILLLLTNISN